MQKLINKVAVITGGSSGIGYATAKLFKEEGATVVITAEREDAVVEAADTLGVLGIVSDASCLKSIRSLYEEIKRQVGVIDILFLNAGVAQFSPICSVDEAFYDAMFDTNVKGVYFNIQNALPIFRNNGSVILNTASLGSKGAPTTSVYAATKAAVRSLARSLSAELLERKIRVNAIAPGPIKTSIFDKLDLPRDVIDNLEVNFVDSTPMKRWGSSEEVAKPALFFASADSSFITGVELAIDGGFSQL